MDNYTLTPLPRQISLYPFRGFSRPRTSWGEEEDREEEKDEGSDDDVIYVSSSTEDTITWDEQQYDEQYLRVSIATTRNKINKLYDCSSSHGAGILNEITDANDAIRLLQESLRDVLAKKYDCNRTAISDPDLDVDKLPWDDSAVYNEMHTKQPEDFTESQLLEQM